jgi:hypothetical protein
MADYSAELRDINKQSVSPWFVPTVDFMTMSCDTMKKNYDKLANQVSMWEIRLASAGADSKSNLEKIVELQSKKMEGYRSALNDCADIAAQLASDSNPDAIAAAMKAAEAPLGDDKKKKLVKILLLGMGGFFLLILLIWVLRRKK